MFIGIKPGFSLIYQVLRLIKQVKLQTQDNIC